MLPRHKAPTTPAAVENLMAFEFANLARPEYTGSVDTVLLKILLIGYRIAVILNEETWTCRRNSRRKDMVAAEEEMTMVIELQDRYSKQGMEGSVLIGVHKAGIDDVGAQVDTAVGRAISA